MKILFVHPRFHTNQIACVKALQDGGHAVHIWVLQRGRVEDYALLEPRTIPLSRHWYRIESHLAESKRQQARLRWAVPSFSAVYSELRKLRPDVVIVREPSFFVGNWVLLSCTLQRIPRVIYTQGPKNRASYSWSLLLAYFAYSKILRAGWYTPVLGQAQSRRSLAGIDYIPFACLEQEPRQPREKNATVRILAVGKMVNRKNHLLLVRVLARLKDRYRFNFTIVGECSSPNHQAYLQKLTTAVAEQGLVDRCQILTNVPHREMQKIYREHDLFVIASTREPASISNLEAMSHGLPVVCSDRNGTACYTSPEVDGVLFRDNDEGSLVEALERLLSDPSMVLAMGSNAFISARTNFGTRAYLSRLTALVNQVAANK